MNSHPMKRASEQSTQRGAALLTALVFLVVLTLLGIGVYSTTTSEEKMARNFRDKEIALQSAEAALNEAKMLINGSYNSGGTPRKPLSEESCYRGTPTGFTCDPTTPVATLDLFPEASPARLSDKLEPTFRQPLPASTAIISLATW